MCVGGARDTGLYDTTLYHVNGAYVMYRSRMLPPRRGLGVRHRRWHPGDEVDQRLGVHTGCLAAVREKSNTVKDHRRPRVGAWRHVARADGND